MRKIVIVLLCWTLVNCSGTHGNIKKFTFKHSKAEVNNAVKIFYEVYPTFKIPAEDRMNLWHYEAYSEDTNKVSRYSRIANSDSVSFYFYNKKNGMLFWAIFEGHNEKWKSRVCDLGLVSVFLPDQTEMYEEQLSDSLKEISITDFDNLVVSKIDSILKSTNR